MATNALGDDFQSQPLGSPKTVNPNMSWLKKIGGNVLFGRGGSASPIASSRRFASQPPTPLSLLPSSHMQATTPLSQSQTLGLQLSSPKGADGQPFSPHTHGDGKDGKISQSQSTSALHTLTTDDKETEGEEQMQAHGQTGQSLQPDDVRRWSFDDVAAWVEYEIGSKELGSLFRLHKIDGEVLLSIAEADLRAPPLNIQCFGDMRRLAFGIENLRGRVGLTGMLEPHEGPEAFALIHSHRAGQTQAQAQSLTPQSQTQPQTPAHLQTQFPFQSPPTPLPQPPTPLAQSHMQHRFPFRQTPTLSAFPSLQGSASTGDLEALGIGLNGLASRAAAGAAAAVGGSPRSLAALQLQQQAALAGQPIVHHPRPLASSWSTGVPTELWDATQEKWTSSWARLLFSYVYLFIVLFITAFTMVLVHERVPDTVSYPPLPDIFLDNVERIPFAFQLVELIILVEAAIFAAILFVHANRTVVMRRFNAILGTCFLIRCVTMFITSLSVPGHHLECTPLKHRAIQEKIARAWDITVGLGLTINNVHTCGDYMFSGHTVVLSILNYCVNEYSPAHWKGLHIMSWVLNIFGMFMILAAHEHYSSRLFVRYHGLANTVYLFAQKKNYEDIEGWFPWVSYLEEEANGVLPNVYEWPWETLRRYYRQYQQERLIAQRMKDAERAQQQQLQEQQAARAEAERQAVAAHQRKQSQSKSSKKKSN